MLWNFKAGPGLMTVLELETWLAKCRFKQVLLYNENAFFSLKIFSAFWTNLVFSKDARKLNSH